MAGFRRVYSRLGGCASGDDGRVQPVSHLPGDLRLVPGLAYVCGRGSSSECLS